MVTDLVIQPSSSIGRISGDMRNQFLFFVVISLLSALPVFGHIEELDFHYWYSDMLPLPGGWTHDKLNKGALDGDWKGGAYFKSMEGWLLSPVFGAPIRSVTFYVASSAGDPTRTMYLYPISGGAAYKHGIGLSSTSNQTYVVQTIPMGEYAANQFVLRLEGYGNKGNWGMERIIVHYGDASTDDEMKPPRNWSVAEFARKPGFREADFSVLQYVTAEANTPWRNGVTIDGFHAFLADESCTKINLASNPTPRYSGLYALDVEEGDGTVRALALNCSGKNAMSLMLPVALDAKRALARLSVAYRVWGLPEGITEAMTFSCQILDDLEQMTAANAKWKTLEPTVDAEAVWTAELLSEDLRGGSYVCLRWHVAERENCPAIGISDVRVSAELEPSGFAVFIR